MAVAGNNGLLRGPQTIDLMIDKRYQPSLRENFVLGVAKAHRSVVYSHYEMRNYNRSTQMPKGRVDG